MQKYILIENDPLFICQRLKEIDKSYFVLYNLKKKQFEVHSKDQLGGSFCFTVRFDALDARTIDYALKTRREHIDEIIKTIDKENERLVASQQKEAIGLLAEVAA